MRQLDALRRGADRHGHGKEQRLLVLPGVKGASYDPSSFHREYPSSKLLIDCTLRSDLSEQQRASFEEARTRGAESIDLADYFGDGPGR